MAVQINRIARLESQAESARDSGQVSDTPETPQAENAPPSLLPDTYIPSFSQRRAELLEDLYTAVASFVLDSAVYEGTTKDDRFRLALLKHRLPRLKELVAELNELSPAETPRKRKPVVKNE